MHEAMPSGEISDEQLRQAIEEGDTARAAELFGVWYAQQERKIEAERPARALQMEFEMAQVLAGIGMIREAQITFGLVRTLAEKNGDEDLVNRVDEARGALPALH